MQPSHPSVGANIVLNAGSTHHNLPNMIPGLGFATSASAQPQSWSGQQRSSRLDPSPRSLLTASQGFSRASPVSQNPQLPAPAKADSSAANDGLEEGEVSEGEVEDIYEPPEAGRLPTSADLHQYLPGRAGPVPDISMMDANVDNRWLAAELGHTRTSRERSGSYSPFLSPQEVGDLDSNNASTGHVEPGMRSSYKRHDPERPRLSPAEFSSKGGAAPSGLPERPPPPSDSAAPFLRPPASGPSLTALHPQQAHSTAKQQAREAIQGLWLLNVCRQNFLDEGIDHAILGGLLQELGLETSENQASAPQGLESEVSGTRISLAPIPPQPGKQALLSSTVPSSSSPSLPFAATKPIIDERVSVAAGKPKDEQKTHNPLVTATSKDEPKAQIPTLAATSKTELTTQAPAPAAKSTDKSEERKDRIARLLAAKKSKPSTTMASAAVTKSSRTATKANSEKSRLLQQKMDALRKAREGLLKSRAQQQASSSSVEKGADIVISLAADTAAAPADAVQISPSIPGSSGQSAESGQPSPSIPGFPLSPMLQQSTEQHPVVSVSSVSLGQAARPFGHRVESRPFLINVSDDDGDEDMDDEMDLDSPDPTTLHAEKGFPSAAAVLRESSLAARNVASQHATALSAAASPQRASSNGLAGDNLANMNKEIEAMKRRIAEAEARKKQKISGQASPAHSYPNESSRAESEEAASTPGGSLTPAIASFAALPAVPMVQGRPGSSHGQGTAGGRKTRHLSAAASERLPLIEARRREQMLKLQKLQAQIAQVEQDIADGMREEQSLKQVGSSDGSDDGQVMVVAQAAPSTANGSETSLSKLDNLPATASEQQRTNQPRPATSSAHEYQTIEHVESRPSKAASQDDPTLKSPDSSSSRLVQHDVAMEDADDEIGDESDEDSSNDAADQDLNVQDAADAADDADDDDSAHESEQESDPYEPPDAEHSASNDSLPDQPGFEPAEEAGHQLQAITKPTEDVAIPEKSKRRSSTDQQPSSAIVTLKGQKNIVPKSSRGENAQPESRENDDSTDASYAPYETPLQYFRAFRFHPDYSKSVPGGLRSLTYSNRIDVRKEVCPDELAGQTCPRGSKCEYQHFDNMRAGDDQILLQLGAASSYQAEQKQAYVAGLKKLLTDFHSRKVKDFDTISRAIIEHRAQFLKDRTKILPLGGVTL